MNRTAFLPEPEPELLLRQLHALSALALLGDLGVLTERRGELWPLNQIPLPGETDFASLISVEQYAQIKDLHRRETMRRTRAGRLSGTVMLSYDGREVIRWALHEDSAPYPGQRHEAPVISYGWGSPEDLAFLLGHAPQRPFWSGPLVPQVPQQRRAKLRNASRDRALLPLAETLHHCLKAGKINVSWAARLHRDGKTGLQDDLDRQPDLERFPLLLSTSTLRSGLPLELHLDNPEHTPSELSELLEAELSELQTRGCNVRTQTTFRTRAPRSGGQVVVNPVTLLPEDAPEQENNSPSPDSPSPDSLSPDSLSPDRLNSGELDADDLAADPQNTETLSVSPPRPVRQYRQLQPAQRPAAPRKNRKHAAPPPLTRETLLQNLATWTGATLDPTSLNRTSMNRTFQDRASLEHISLDRTAENSVTPDSYARARNISKSRVALAIYSGALPSTRRGRQVFVLADAPWPPSGWSQHRTREEMHTEAFGGAGHAGCLEILESHRARLSPRMYDAVHTDLITEGTMAQTAAAIGCSEMTFRQLRRTGLAKLAGYRREAVLARETEIDPLPAETRPVPAPLQATSRPRYEPDVLHRQLLALGSGPLLSNLKILDVSEHPLPDLREIPDPTDPVIGSLLSLVDLAALNLPDLKTPSQVKARVQEGRMVGAYALSYCGRNVTRWAARPDSAALPTGKIALRTLSVGWGDLKELDWLLGQKQSPSTWKGPLTPSPLTPSSVTADPATAEEDGLSSRRATGLVPLALALTQALARGNCDQSWQDRLHPRGKNALAAAVYGQPDWQQAFPLLADCANLCSGLPLELALAHADVTPRTLMKRLDQELQAIHQRPSWTSSLQLRLPPAEQTGYLPLESLISIEDWAALRGLSPKTARNMAMAERLTAQHVVQNRKNPSGPFLRRFLQRDSEPLNGQTFTPIIRDDLITTEEYRDNHQLPRRVLEQAVHARALQVSERPGCTLISRDAPWPPPGWTAECHSAAELSAMAFGHLRPAQRPAALRRYQGKLREKLYRSAEMQLSGSTFTVIAQQIGVTKKSADDLTREAFARIIGLQRTEPPAQQT